MFRSKEDVDRHVNEVFRNIRSEYERNLKCYQIAKLYYKFKDYKSAIKYLNRYVLTTPDSAAAHKILGECYMATNLKIKALESFKTSLELNGSQNNLLLEICNLLLDPDVASTTPKAFYWLERAESLFPENPVVMELKERLPKSNLDGKQDNGQLEKYFLAEIRERPLDVTVRIRLLNLFLNTNRYKVAYQYSLELEDRNTFSNDPLWYDCLCNVVMAYENANSGLGYNFIIKKIIFLEKRADLCMQEFQKNAKVLTEASSALFALDQHLFKASKVEVPPEDKIFFSEFLKHMKCQLAFHLATLALRRAKKEYGIWSKTICNASPLLLQATINTMDLEGAWYSMWSGKTKFEKDVKQLNKSASVRISQAGHVLIAWAQGKSSNFLDKVSQFCGGKWQTRVYKDIFYVRAQQQATGTSEFINDPFFADVPKRLLTEVELIPFDEVSQSAYPDSLHHLVWLGLAYCNSKGQLSPNFKCMTVPDLQFTVSNLSQCGPETLNQLDVDAFLYASVLCAKSAKSDFISTDRPSRLPVSISEELCSPAQAEWWTSVHKTYSNSATDNLRDMRLKLRSGIETIRVLGQHGLHIKVIVMLAKLFQERAAKNKNVNELSGLEERAYLYWSTAIPLLEKLEKNHRLREVPNKLFDYKGKELSPVEIKSFLEDGKLFLACRLMKQGRYEQAIEASQNLKSPYATFYQGLIYEKLASDEVNHRPEQITSENRSQHIILLTRARSAFYLTLDRLRSPSADPNHPLISQLQDHLEKIENQLAIIQPDGGANRNGDSESNETDTAPGHYSPEVEENLDASFNVYNASNLVGLKNHSTTKNLRQTLSDKHHFARFEARPSPERLDAQLRHLIQTNNTFCQAVVEQLKEMQISIKDVGCVTRDILAEFKRANDINSKLIAKRETIKPDDLFELREEDYEDLTQLSQQYNSYPTYPVNRQISTQGTSTVTYGTSVPSPVPPVPPVIPTPEIHLIQPSLYPGGHTVSPMDPNLSLYQTLGYYAQGMAAYGENQNVPDYRGTGIQKGAPFVKNAYKALEPVSVPVPVPVPTPTSTVFTSASQPPNVVITSSDTLPAFTNTGTPTMSVTVPPQHIRGFAPTLVAQKPNPNQVHPFQIQMPPQAQLIKENPMEKLNAMIPTTVGTTPIQGGILSGVVSSPVQKTPVKEVSPPKSATQIVKDNKLRESKPVDESRLFECRGNLFVLEGKEWVDKGQVFIKIFRNEKAAKAQIVAMEELLFNVVLDHYITPEMNLEPLKLRESGWIWSATNLNRSDLKPEELKTLKPVTQKYKVQFSFLDEARDFEFAFNEGRRLAIEAAKGITPPKESEKAKECKICKGKVEGISEKCAACVAKEKTNEKTNLGGFTFTSSPIVKPSVLKINENKEKPKETPKPSPFAEFSFSGTPTTTATPTINANATSTPVKPFADTSNIGNTGSTNWFAGVKADPNSFKKDKNFSFKGSDTLVFGYLNKPKTPTTPASKSEKTTPKKSNEDEEDGEDEFVPTAEFKPVVDLPDLVDVKTEEENDKVLFNMRAKLLRFDTTLKEWKERGVGNMKVLLNEETGKVRLIMRRELVLKVCCNHYLDEKMDFKRMIKSEKALTWYAQDYSEGDLKPELFALRFATPENMVNFETVIKDTQAKMKDGRIGGKPKDSKEEKKPTELKPLSELFKPKTGSWECSTCLIRNNKDSLKCVSCETPKPGTEVSKSSPSQTSTLGKGITLDTKFTFGIPQNTTPSTTQATKLTFGTPKTTPSTGFTFGIPQTTTSTSSASQFVFGIPQTNTTTASKLSFDTNVSSSISTSGFTFGSGTGISTTSSSAPNISFGTTPHTTASVTQAAPKITFSLPSTISPSVKEGNIFGGKPLTFSSSKTGDEKSKTEISTPQTTFSFANALKPGEKEKFEFTMSNIKPLVNTTTTSLKGKGDGDASDESDGELEEDNGDHIIVQPVVPLPDKVALYTGEEDEDVLYEQRAKLYRFTDKEWKERGIGDVKILKHKTTNKLRLLMRRETILKLCLNHYLTPEIDFSQKDEKSWQWSAPDFSEGEVINEMFAIRFKTPEIAKEFKKAIDNARNNVLTPLLSSEVKGKSKEPTETMKSFSFAVPNSQKPELPKGTSDDDISVIYEATVTPEQREQAINLQLPPNFYAYLQAPDCPGCPGCDKEETPVPSQQISKPDSTTPATTSQFTFGTSSFGSLNFGKGGGKEGNVLFTFVGNLATSNFGGPKAIVKEEEGEVNEEDEEGENDDSVYNEEEEDNEDYGEEEEEEEGDDDDDNHNDDDDDDDDDDEEEEEEEETEKS